MGELRVKRTLCAAIASVLVLQRCLGLAVEGAEGLLRAGEFGTCRRQAACSIHSHAHKQKSTQNNRQNRISKQKQSHWTLGYMCMFTLDEEIERQETQLDHPLRSAHQSVLPARHSP